jgi:hypothetical protein
MSSDARPATTPTDATPRWRFRDSDLWYVLRETYGVFDRRQLGFTRLLLGFYLIMDLFRRTADWNAMFSTRGVLPNDVSLWRPQASNAWTLLHAFSTSTELAALWVVIFATYVCLFIGYQTKVAQILTVFFVTSLNGRVLLIENGGYVVQSLLTLWTAFLPLGDRFSVDSMLRSMKRTREASEDDLNDPTNLDDPERANAHYTLMGLVLVVQLAAIYYFNVIHKTGPAWKNGQAVHFVLYVDRMANPLIGLVRDYIPNWAILFMTKTTLMFEATIPIVVLSPLAKVWARRMAIAMINALHIGFGVTFVLGPFAWACCIFSTLLFQREDWELAARTMRRPERARTVLYDVRSGAAFWACRVLRRCDGFDLLDFRATDDAKGALAALRPDGTRVEGATALLELLRALPLGPIPALFLGLPGFRQALDAALRRPGSKWFGLRLPSGPSFVEGPRSSLSRVGRGAVIGLREALVMLMFASAINQALVELWVTRNLGIGQPEPFRTLAHKLRFLQGWFMFSPNPVMDDGTIVVDAITIDGRHVDPFWAKEPNFDLLGAKSFRYNQIWSDYFNRIHMGSNTAYRDAMKAYMLRLPERTGNPNDAIVSGDVYWVQDMNPKWNTTESYDYQRKKLFSFEGRPQTKRVDGAEPAGSETPPGERPALPNLRLDRGKALGLRENLPPPTPTTEPAPPPEVQK